MSRLAIGTFALALSALGRLALAQGDDQEIQQTVARVAFLEGDVTYNRGDDPDNWQPAGRNFPMTIGDRLYASRGAHAELQIRGSHIYLAPETDITALNLTEDVKQLSIGAGIARFRVNRLEDGETYEVDTPNSSITFDRPGEYRVAVDLDGNTRVGVSRGSAHVAAGGGEVPLEAGQEIDIQGLDRPSYDVVRLSRPDPFDRWVEIRVRRLRDVVSARYVSDDVTGTDDLDEYGRWEDIAEYGHVWTPRSVASGWEPYRAGRWIWQDPWGWTWISEEPWGWAPYHYGRWAFASSRWCWVPGNRSDRRRYSPALVAFIGGGPSFGGGNVGWFPLAPRDPLIPWWGGRRADVNVNVTNITYVNRTHVTVVNQSTFVSGGLVARNIVRDQAVIRGAVAAPVLRGFVPIPPTTASLRVSAGPVTGVSLRPSAAIIGRPVVTRMAPPPAPPSFALKAPLIRAGGGAPVTPIVSTRISGERPGAPRAVIPVRPVAAEAGSVVLTPRGGNAPAAHPVSIPAPGGRPLATKESPVAAPSAGVRSGTGEEGRPRPAREVGRIDGGGRVVNPPASQPAPRAEPARPAERPAPAPQPVIERREAAPRPVERKPAPAPQPVIERREAPPRPVERQPAPAPAVERHEAPPPRAAERPAPPPPRPEVQRPAPKQEEKPKPKPLKEKEKEKEKDKKDKS